MTSLNQWRLANPDKRNSSRKRNYALGNQHATNSGDKWTGEYMRMIVASDRPTDRVLAVRIGRSVQAIQIMRSRSKSRT